MGRPIPKRFFGNENTNDSGDTIDTYGRVVDGGTTAKVGEGIGGDGVASVTIDTAGSYTSALPTVEFSAPNLAGAGGVTATGVVHGNALTAVATAAGSGYNLADILTQTTGGTGTYATWTVTGLTSVGITLNNGGSANDVGDEFTFAASGFATPIRVRVTASNAGVATEVSIVSGGVWTTGALPGNTIGMVRTQVAAGTDFNGTGLEVNFTAWGVATVAVVTQGDYTAISGGAKATSVTPAGGTSATLTITYGVSGVEVTDPGSGYTTVADAAPTFSVGAAAGTSVLTVDNETTPYTPEFYNAILITAYIPTDDGGSSAVLSDILSQKNTTRYRVTNAQGTGVVSLVAGTPAAGEATVIATDSEGKTYYSTKITRHLVTLVPIDGEMFEANSSVHWTLTTFDPSYDAETTVILNNA